MIFGLDSAGKTTLLYKLKSGETKHTVPTIGFSVETVDIGNIIIQAWDVGGLSCWRMKDIWRPYF